MKSKTRLIVGPNLVIDISKFNVEQLRVLYVKASNHQLQRNQWANSQNYAEAARYAAKLEAVIELIEGITVFNHGNGIHPYNMSNLRDGMVHNNSLDKRLASIGLIFEHVDANKFRAAKPVKAKVKEKT